MHVRSEIILKGVLYDSLAAALKQLDQFSSSNEAEAIYRLGFRAALETIAIAHGLNMPEVRNAQAEERRRNCAVTVYDMRL